MHRPRLLTAFLAVAPLVFLWPVLTAGHDARATDSAPAPALPAVVATAPATATEVPDGPGHGAVRAAVRDAVRQALAGAPLPRLTHPAVTPRLGRAAAPLGRCDYGVPHANTGGALCPRGDPHGTRTVVLFGDSHARHWVPALQALAERHHLRAYYLVKQQCTAAILPNGDPDLTRPEHPWSACHDFREWALKTIAQLDPEVVVVSSSVPTKGVFTPHGYVRGTARLASATGFGFEKLWSRLHAATDARLVLLRDVPARTPDAVPTACFAQPDATQRTCLSRDDAHGPQAREHLGDVTDRVARRAGVQVIDPRPWFCWHGWCPGVIGHYLPYRNAGHLTVPYARHLAEPLGYYLHL